MKILITGGAGFIGSALVRYIIDCTECEVVVVDKLTYAGNLSSLKSVESSSRFSFCRLDICDSKKMAEAFQQFMPDAVMHLAAESHVDRSIDGPSEFIQTNIYGTYVLLEAAREYWSTLKGSAKDKFRFHHVSTDEVYGDLEGFDTFFTETTSYDPSSPYSASKAASDHLVRAWYRTYGMPVLVTNCSNNYGPFHFPEKLIPHVLLSALKGRAIPVYGDGSQVRDWLYVEDHARALYQVLKKGEVGETYNIGGNNEKRNIDVVQSICDLLEELVPDNPMSSASGAGYASLIEFVSDRPGHDVRYAIDATKIKKELSWEPIETFESGIRKTIKWYLDNELWWKEVLEKNYELQRLGGRV